MYVYVLFMGFEIRLSNVNSTGFAEYMPVDSPVQDQAGITVQATIFNRSSRLCIYVPCFTDRGLEHHHYEKHCKGNTIVRCTDRLPKRQLTMYLYLYIRLGS